MPAGSSPASRTPTGPPGGSRTVLVTFLGAVVRRFDGWMPVAAAVELMAPLGLDATSVRTAISRLKKRGWLHPEVRARARGYSLTPDALAALTAGDELIWHPRAPARLADGWCIVHFSIPEAARRQRHQLRAHLAAVGFGNVGTALWIAPARMREAAVRAIDELGLAHHAAVFQGDYVAGQPIDSLLYASWDLATIDRRYRDFIAGHAALAQRLAAGSTPDPPDAFVRYVEVVDRWRRLPFRDPGLPAELLAPDWNGPVAGALFERLVAWLEPGALLHAATFWPAEKHSA